MKSKKLSGFIPLLTVLALVGCGGGGGGRSKYQVNESRWNEICNYDNFIRDIATFNYTVTYSSMRGDKSYEYVTKYDNGKIYSFHGDDSFFCDFKKGTYKAEGGTWTLDYYYQQDGAWKMNTFVDETLPDDIYFPDPQFLVTYSEVVFSLNTNTYVVLSDEPIERNMYEMYTDVEVGFLNQNLVFYGYHTYKTSKPEEIERVEYRVSDFGSTKVTLPVVE